MLYRHCREGRGSDNALYFDGETYSYQQIAEEAARCTVWLYSLGIKPGNCVILCMPDCVTLVATYFGVVAAGAIAIILDPALTTEDAFYIAQLCEARLTISYEKVSERVQGLRSVPGMLAVIGAGLTWKSASELTSALAPIRSPDYPMLESPTGHAYGLLSSGSTGRPKLIVHRHQDILHGHFGFAGPVIGWTVDDRSISVAKMTTGYGLGCSVLMPFLRGASSVLVSEAPTATTLTHAIEAHRCTLLFAQPRFLAEEIAASDLADRLRSLRLVVTGGEPLAGALVDRWSRFSHVELLDSYGSTEVGFLYISNRPGDSRRGSVGRPIDGLQVEVVDGSGGVVQSGQIGKLKVRGPMIIDGYWNDPVRTLQSFHNRWFVTSDLFSLDGDGYYYIHGRSDHLIKLGCGDWVNPIELETVLLEHPSVRECAIVGAPDDHGLTVLRAIIIVDVVGLAGQELAVELATMVRERWPAQKYKRIEIVEFPETLPKTPAGKLDRSKLQPRSMTEFSYKC